MPSDIGLVSFYCFTLHSSMVNGYVDYIPPSPSLCDDMIPPVRTRKRQETENWYYQIAQWETLNIVRILVLGTKRYKMKGFLIQVRRNNNVYGEFMLKDGAILIDCPPGKKNTIYYIQPNYTTRLNCFWVPPKDYSDNDRVFVFTTTLKKLSKYWLSVERLVPKYPILPTIDFDDLYEDNYATTMLPIYPGCPKWQHNL